MQPCLFCSGDASDPDHRLRCDGRQGLTEALADFIIPPLPPVVSRSAHQLARAGDPDTSHDAAAAIVPDLREIQANVLALLRELGEMTHHALIARYRERHGIVVPESTIRTRCAELVSGGLVLDSGQRVRLPSGRRAIVWRAAA